MQTLKKKASSVAVLSGLCLAGLLGYLHWHIPAQLIWVVALPAIIMVSLAAVGIVLLFRNINLWEGAQTASVDKALKYKVLFENLSEAVTINEMIYDEAANPVDWLILDANPTFVHAAGTIRQDLVGSRMSQVFGTDQMPSETLHRFDQVVRTGTPTRFEAYFEPLRMQLLLSVFYLGGTHFAILATNITERKLTGATLRQLNETLEEQVKELTERAETRSRQLRKLDTTAPVEIQALEPEPDCQTPSILIEAADGPDSGTRVLMVDDHQVLRQGSNHASSRSGNIYEQNRLFS